MVHQEHPWTISCRKRKSFWVYIQTLSYHFLYVQYWRVGNHNSRFLFSSKFLWLRQMSCTSEPGVERFEEVRAIVNISGEAKALLQQLLCIWQGKCGNDSQECFLQLHTQVLVAGKQGWMIFADKQNRKPMLYKLLSNLRSWNPEWNRVH